LPMPDRPRTEGGDVRPNPSRDPGRNSTPQSASGPCQNALRSTQPRSVQVVDPHRTSTPHRSAPRNAPLLSAKLTDRHRTSMPRRNAQRLAPKNGDRRPSTTSASTTTSLPGHSGALPRRRLERESSVDDGVSFLALAVFMHHAVDAG